MVKLGPVKGQESREWAEAVLWGPGVETMGGCAQQRGETARPAPSTVGA